MQPYLKNDQGVVKHLNPIGDMRCDDAQFKDYYKINGSKVGELKMNFEADSDGIAVKFRKRNGKLLMKTGERDSANSKVFKIPEHEELVGFHGK